jgi:1-acyl-sn-glycerol-3-phosphate acyltransferase
LGEDWKPTFEGAGIQVANHQSWIDIMALLNTQVPCFVAKEEIRKFPGVGKIAASIRC